MTKDVWVCLAGGFEEIEALTPVDYLRRAGARVKLLGLEESLLRGARSIRVETDGLLEDQSLSDGSLPDCIILPGGLGCAKALASSELVHSLVRIQLASKGILAAICASPALVLSAAGVLDGRTWTCYPGMEKDVSSGIWSGERVVVDGNLVSSRGPGCAEEFSLVLIELLFGSAARLDIARAIVSREAGASK